jgi:hypothetical protein
LLRWLNGRDGDAIFSMFGVLEGAGFQAGAVRPYMLIRRAVAVSALVQWARSHLEEITESGGPLPTIAIQRGVIDARATLEASEPLVEMAVLPCLVAALSCAVADRAQLGRIEKAQFVHDRLATDLNHIPTFGWLPAALLFAGRADVRERLYGSLFKLQKADIRQSCLSAAWDLGYLQMMNIARLPFVRSEWLDGRSPVLVTDDRPLSWVASSLIECVSDTGDYAIAPTLWDPALRDRALELLAQNQRDRMMVAHAFPDWVSCERAARGLFVELDVDDPATLRLQPETVWVAPMREDTDAYVRVVLNQDAADALRTMNERVDGDPLFGALWVVVDLARDNAEARQRSVEETWEAFAALLMGELGELEPDESLPLLGALAMPEAVWAKRWEHLTAALEGLQIEPTGYRTTVMYLWKIGRMMMKDTADARGMSMEEMSGLLEHWAKHRQYPVPTTGP